MAAATNSMTSHIAKLPIAIGVVGCLVLFLDFAVIQLFGDRRELGGAVLQTPSQHLDVASSRLLASKKIALSFAKTPIGKLGPANTQRHNFRYYDTLYYTSLQFGYDAKSIIEVGCASVPFIKHLDWVDKRTCVAPYFVQYEGTDKGNENTQLNGTTSAIESVVADFMEYEVADYSYDLLICSQVLEHVPNPSEFMKKLIRTAKTAVISVPFRWPDCGETCNHKTDDIDYKVLIEWSFPHKPIYASVVQERLDGNRNVETSKRIILVFQSE